MPQDLSISQKYDVFVGIDVDKKSFAFTVTNNQMMLCNKKIPSQPEMLYNYIRNNFDSQRVLCAYEAGPTGYHLYDYLKQKQLPCLVVSPLSIPKPGNQRVKNNRLDSERIATYLKSGQLQSIRIPENDYRELRHLINMREIYADNRKKTKQRIKSLLLFAHLEDELKDTDKGWSNRYLQKLKELTCAEGARQRLDMLLMDLDYARAQTLAILNKLKIFCQQHKEIDRYRIYLQSIPGIGCIIALTILSRIGDPANLKNPRELGAFIGLVPREHSTGESINKGSITHLGDRTLRMLLIETAWVAIRRDTELNEFYNRVKNRHHSTFAARKAIVAVARKLTHRIYTVLKEQRMYVIH